MGWLSDIVEAVIDGVAAWSRKKAPEKDVGFGRNHFPNMQGVCIYCDKPRARENERCPGPPLGRAR